jgi:arginyl-tRNA synthetase
LIDIPLNTPVLHKLLEKAVQSAVAGILPDADLATVQVRPSTDAKFGDYQCNSLMALAKERKRNPRQLAEEVLKNLDVSDLAEKVEIAGAGFLNFRIKPAAISATLSSAHRGEHLFFQPAQVPRTVVVDFSSPNVAKSMHVGHIRSTILGDAIARVLRLLGQKVITDNHIGDWGTQFGMLIYATKTRGFFEKEYQDPIAELEKLYKTFTKACEGDAASIAAIVSETPPPSGAELLERARQELVKLQQGDAENKKIWEQIRAVSQKQFDTVYHRLGVTFDFTRGESFYNPWLQEIVDELLQRGIARQSEGAVAVFSDGTSPQKEDPFLSQKDGKWVDNPALIQKNDGGFNYTTTDLATLRHRLREWNPSEIAYVTDGRQQLHFRQLFTIFRRWHPEASIKLAHVWFGSILGPDNKPYKTRSGETVKLAELLDEAEERALAIVTEKNPTLTDNERREIARVVGIGAVKYSDLLPNRQSDYVFSWDKMLALTGNTAPYLQYAYTRLRGITRKAAEVAPAVPSGPPLQPEPIFNLTTPEELAVARHLLNFGIVLEAVAEEYRPNFLCNYLYELATLLSRFYEQCPVLKAEGQSRIDRLALCELAARVLKEGLNLLGIETTERM